MADQHELDDWVWDRLQDWMRHRGVWQGDVTLRFGPSGIETVREKRLTAIASLHVCHLWGDIQYGRTTMIIQNGERRMIEEERTHRRPEDTHEPL